MLESKCGVELDEPPTRDLGGSFRNELSFENNPCLALRLPRCSTSSRPSTSTCNSITAHLPGPQTLTQCVNSAPASSSAAIGLPAPAPATADRKPRSPTMNTTRFLRPFTRAAFRAPTAVRPAAMARPALASQQQKKTPEVGAQQMVRLPFMSSNCRGC
jgi:hypothetical protein